MRHRYTHLIQLVKLAEPSKLLLSLALVLAFIETGAAIWAPLLTRDLIDGQFQKLVVILLGIVLILQALTSGFNYYLLGFVGHKMVANLRQKLFGRLLRLPVGFFDDNESGELVSRVTTDTETISSLITDRLVSVITGLVMITGSLIILWLLDWRMTLTLFGSVFITVVVIVPIALSLHSISKGIQDQMAEFTTRLSSVFSQIRLVKASQAETHETNRVNRSINNLLGLGLRETRIQALLSPVVSIALTGAMIVILGYGGSRVSSGELEVGVLVAFILYMFNVAIPMVQFSTFFAELQRAAGAGERMAVLLDKEPEHIRASVEIPDNIGALTFENVNFSFDDERGPVLKEVSFELEPGKTTALVGPSGSGKSTLFALMERFYQPDEGTISLDGVPINQFHLGPWRSLLGYVAQDTPAISGTIRDNICYGLSDVSNGEVDAAVEAALLKDFIASLPSGYDTELGERGVKLSGGQRQRLAIARALLVDPAILIMDEPTSSLDTESERLITAAINNLTQNRTTIIAAHRPGTVMNANRILVLEKGHITGVGNHQSLLENNTFYQKMTRRQEGTGVC